MSTKPIDGHERPRLEALIPEVTRIIRSSLPSGVGCTVLIFDYGGGPDAGMAYCSTATRREMIAAIKEILPKLEAGL